MYCRKIVLSSTNAEEVGLFVRNTLNCEITNEFELNTPCCKELWITVQTNKTKKGFGAFYRHPQSQHN